MRIRLSGTSASAFNRTISKKPAPPATAPARAKGAASSSERDAASMQTEATMHKVSANGFAQRLSCKGATLRAASAMPMPASANE